MHTIEESHITNEPWFRSGPDLTQKFDGEVAERLQEIVAVEDTKNILAWVVTYSLQSANHTHIESRIWKASGSMVSPDV